MRALSLSIVVVFLTSCATNPAKHLEPNGADLRVSTVDPVGLYRGDEKLDEQDFYELSGDTESLEAVKGSRSAGGVMQIGGASLVTVGVAAMAFGFLNGLLADGGVLGEKGLYPAGTIDGLVGYLIAGAGGLAVFGGGSLFVAGGNKVKGEPPVFDLKHAQAAIERGRYGEGGLKPENISSLVLTTTSAKASYCVRSGALVKPLAALDKNGKEIAIQEHLDWVTVNATPADAVSTRDVFTGVDTFVQDEDETVEGTYNREAAKKDPPKEYVVSSPLNRSLANYLTPVTLSATVKGTNVSTTLKLEQDLECAEEVDFGGRAGSAGSWGDSGASGSSSRSAGSGGSGGPGGDGSSGPDVDAEAAWVRDPFGKRLALVAWSSGGSTGATLIGPRGSLTLDASGGPGGRGGSGGKGGRGVSGDSKRCPSDGGNGGSGGNGGRGGSGGRVRLELSDDSLSGIVSASVRGGSGGSGGSQGRGGSGGSSSKGCSNARSGSDGSSGQSGPRGSDGSVTKKTVPAAQLELVQRALKDLKGFKLDGAADAPMASPSSSADDASDADAPPAAPAAKAKKSKKKK